MQYDEHRRCYLSRIYSFFDTKIYMNAKIFIYILVLYYVAKGATYNDNCNDISCETRAADISEQHRVRCCSDEAIDGWSQKVGCSVWAESNVWGGCKKMNYHDARLFCEMEEGRLCTKDELEDSCTELTGCGYDFRLVWSSTIAE